MITRLIDRIFTAIDRDEKDILNQIISDSDSALKDGSKDTIQLKYVRLPDRTIDITDKDNGEHTVIKKSGSCMMMKSGNLGMFSIPTNRSSYKDFVSLFSSTNEDNFDTYVTKAFALFDKLPTLNDVKSVDDSEDVRNESNKLKEKGQKLSESLVKKKEKLSNGELTDAEADRLKADIDVINEKIKLNDINIDGLESQLKRDPDMFNDSLVKASKSRAKLEKLQEVAKRSKELDEQERLEKQQNNRNNLGDEDKMKKNLNNKFVSKDKKFSKAGYSEERDRIISLLLNLRECKDNKHKSHVLSSLESILNSINDSKIKGILSSMISELKRLSINDSQYDQIISDTIDNMKTDGITRLFSDRALKAITKFYAWQDNQDAYNQYVAGRRRDRLKTLGTAGALALGGGLAYNYFNQNGVQPITDLVHKGANALSRAANNPNAQWTAPTSSLININPATQAAKLPTQHDAAQPQSASLAKNDAQATQVAEAQPQYDSHGVNYGDSGVVANTVEDDTWGNTFRRWGNNLKQWGRDLIGDDNKLTTHTEFHKGTLVNNNIPSNDPHSSPYAQPELIDTNGDGIGDAVDGM